MVDRDLVIIGAGGLGREIASWLQASGKPIAGFLDDRFATLTPPVVNGLPILGMSKSVEILKAHPFIIALGHVTPKTGLANWAKETGLPAAMPFVSPLAVVFSQQLLPEGTIIGPQAFLSVDTHLGGYVTIDTRAHVGHDVSIGSFTHVSVRATICGGVKIGESSYIGAGSTILPHLTIGAGATVGAGAVVTKDVPAGVTVVGNPAQAMAK